MTDRWNPVDGDWLPQDLIRNRSSALALTATDDEERTDSQIEPISRDFYLCMTSTMWREIP